MVVAMIPLLLLHSARANQVADVGRMTYKSGYSVVMPRPFIKRNQKFGPVFIGVENDRIYIVTSTALSRFDLDAMAVAQSHGTEAYQKWLESYTITFTMEAKAIRREAGAFRGMPCVRRVYEVKSGERGALLGLFNGNRLYLLLCVNPPGDADLRAAQRFFNSFKIEKSVEADPALADPPVQDPSYPPADENSGTV